MSPRWGPGGGHGTSAASTVMRWIHLLPQSKKGGREQHAGGPSLHSAGCTFPFAPKMFGSLAQMLK